MKSQKLEEVNRDNLLKGLDSGGNDLPYYSNSEYGYDKMRRNPRNRGRWDLKNTGQYHRNIYTVFTAKSILFKQRLRNKKVFWLEMMLDKANREPLGITKAQIIDAQKKNIPIVKPKLLEIINKGK